MTDPTAAAFARIVGTVDKDLMKDYPQPSVPDTVPSGLKQETRVTIKPEQVKRNAFTENLGADWIGTDANGNVLVRGDEAATRAHPDAVAWFTGKDLAEPPAAEVPKIENVAKNDAGAEAMAEELEAAKGEVAKMDPDGDGKVGGSRKKAAKK